MESGGDMMKMTPSEQEAMDVQGTEFQHVPEEGHKSMVGKVKDKAKKLTSKIKGVGKKKPSDEHGNEIDMASTSSGDEGEDHMNVQDINEPSSGVDTKVHGGIPYSKPDHVDKATREMADLNVGEIPAQKDPVAPTPGTNVPFSSEETRKRQHEVPASYGQESAGISSDLQQSHLGSGNERYSDSSSVAAGEMTRRDVEKIPEGIMKPTRHEDTEMKPAASNGGVDNSRLSSHVVGSGGESWIAGSGDGKPVSEHAKESDRGFSGAKEAAVGATGVGLGAAGHEHSSHEEGAGTPKGWMQRATESVTSVKNAISSKLSSPRTTTESSPTTTKAPEDKTWTRDTVVGAKDSLTSKLPSSTSPTESHEAKTSTGDVPQAGTAPGITTRAVETASGITTRVTDTAVGVKDTIASKLGYGTGVQEQQHPVAEAENVVSDEKKAAPSVTERVMGTVTGAKDVVASKLGYGGESEAKGAHDTQAKMFTPDEHDTALSQKITDMLSRGGGNSQKEGHTTATTPPTTDEPQQGKGYMERVTGAVGSLLGKKDEKSPAATGTTDPNPAAQQ